MLSNADQSRLVMAARDRAGQGATRGERPERFNRQIDKARRRVKIESQINAVAARILADVARSFGAVTIAEIPSDRVNEALNRVLHAPRD
ncbi:MAG: hypothetical protein CMQ40_12850 [Gammaproteobacteria bacterium]|nr:hypothetical protein [Gammaproteobacteria bacterium]